MRIALLTSDTREVIRDYASERIAFGTAPEALLQGFGKTGKVEVHVISCLQQPVISPSQVDHNIWFHSLHVPKLGWLRTGYQGCIRAVRRKLKEIAPQIVHGQGTERDCAISAVLSGFPNVITIHGNMREIERVNRPKPFTYGWLAARLEAFTLPRSGGVICITEYTRRSVEDLARQTWVVPNGVDGSFFDLRRIPETPPLILCVGSIMVRKNQNAFIRALDPLRQRHPFSVSFLGVTGEKSDPYTAEFFREIEARTWCRYEGFADRAKLKSYFERASLVVLPSLEDNCPMVVLEAMAAGVPVAAASVGGVPELISPGRTGLLFNPLDAASMRDTVEEMLANPDLRHRLANEAQAEARQRFHPTVIARRHLEIYRELLDGFRSAKCDQ